jgi:hypothetical protein
MALEAVGHNGTVILDSPWIIIDRSRHAKGPWFARGGAYHTGSKKFLITAVSAVQLKIPKGNYTANRFGFIEFSFAGGSETTGLSFGWSPGTRQVSANLRNENAVTFEPDQLEAFVALEEAIQAALAELGRQKNSEPRASDETGSVSDDLDKLADLLSKGLLTQEEFQKAKTKLLE